MQKRLRVLLSFLIISLFIFGAVGCANQTAANTNLVSVKTAIADKHKLQTRLDIAGVLVPAQTVNIVSKMTGQITRMDFNVGSTVKSGDVLIELEAKALNAQLQQAQAGLQSAQAAAQSVKNQAELAKINLNTAQKAYDDTKALYDSGAVSKSQLDDVVNKLDLAKKQYENASGSSENQAQAAINTANANINSIRVQMENTVVSSPINGIIVNRNINPGEIASPGVPLLTIADTSTLKLKGTVSQEVLPLLQVGQEIKVSIDIYPDKEYKGKIENIGPMAVSTGEVFPIEISIDNTDGIKAGLSAHASLDIADEKGVIVPASSVVTNNGESYVFVIKDNVASKRLVTIGLKSDKEIEILGGLDAGEKVAITSVNSLFDNMPVNVN